MSRLGETAHDKGYTDVREAMGREPFPVADEAHLADWEALLPDAMREIREEMPLLRTRLLVERPEIAAEYDRLQAEADLRFAIALSGAALLVTLALLDSVAWLIGLAFAGILAWQGTSRARDGNDVLADALLAETVEAPTITRMRATVDAARSAAAADVGHARGD